jgi:FkbM family methyltransferase
MAPSLYEFKKALLTPRTSYRRRKTGELADTTRQIFELSYYATPVYDFLGATMANPDILIDAPLDESSVVLDVGAFVGQWCEKIDDRYGCRIHAYEPSPPAIGALAKRLADRPNIVPCAYGLGGSDQVASLEVHGPGSTIYGERPPDAEVVDVQIRDVVKVLEELDVDRIELMKVNIEGGEYELFERIIEAGWLHRFRTVLIQFHEWHPGAYRRRFRIRRALARHHTEEWCYPWLWEKWTRI